MSMLTMNGQLLNIYVSPKGKKENGDEYGGQDKVQILGDVSLPNGETRKDMFTLTAHNVSDFKQHIGKEITVPVGAIANGKVVTFFIPKGSIPSVKTSLMQNPSNRSASV